MFAGWYGFSLVLVKQLNCGVYGREIIQIVEENGWKNLNSKWRAFNGRYSNKPTKKRYCKKIAGKFAQANVVYWELL